jgi:hypothetical protein
MIADSDRFKIQRACQHESSRIGIKAIKTKRQTLILGPGNDFGQQIGNHLFRNTEKHHNIPKTNVTLNHVVTNLDMPNIP